MWNDKHSFSVTIHDLFSLYSLFFAKVRWNQNKNYQRIKKPVLKAVIIVVDYIIQSTGEAVNRVEKIRDL